MGNSVSRPSCLGEKSPRSEDFRKAPGAATRNNEEDCAGPLEKAILSPRVIENGWNRALEGAGKSSPLPKQNSVDAKLQNCPSLKAPPEGTAAAWTSPKGLGSSWGWRPRTAREVLEVTEVTETVVTEIVEVTEYPGGDQTQEALVARTVKVLADFAGALPEAAAFPGDVRSTGLTQEMAGKLLAWVSDVEDIVAHQKPPSGEARVVKAQLQEQKLLLRLLEERTSHVERLGPGSQMLPAELVDAAEGQEQPGGLTSLQEKWAILVREAKARHSSLQQILPAADVFQESVDSFQGWLSFMEKKLTQLWQAHGSLALTQEAHRQIQDLCEEVQSKPAELEQALGHGQYLLEMVPGKWEWQMPARGRVRQPCQGP
ncbi:uncharacterized protein PHA67_016073 [Liasis olivaceus]